MIYMKFWKTKNLISLVLLFFGSITYFSQKYLITSEYKLQKTQIDRSSKHKKLDKDNWWKPNSRLTFHIQHISSREEAENLPDVDVVNLELSQIQRYLEPNFFKNRNIKLVCYFSASYESWRLDADLYPKDAIGNKMREWNESWGNIDKESLKTFLEGRMNLAQSLGCDAIEIDNTDPAFNTEETGFIITKEQNKDALIDLSNRAHKKKLAIFLKNTSDLAKELEPYFEGVFNEQCAQYNECSVYYSFVKAGKPVFQVEYDTCKVVPGHVIYKKDDYFSKNYTVCK